MYSEHLGAVDAFTDDFDHGTTLYCWDKYSVIILLVCGVLRLCRALQQDFHSAPPGIRHSTSRSKLQEGR